MVHENPIRNYAITRNSDGNIALVHRNCNKTVLLITEDADSVVNVVNVNQIIVEINIHDCGP